MSLAPGLELARAADLTVPTIAALAADLPGLSQRRVTVIEPVDLGGSVDECLAVLRILRDATSHAVRLSWKLSGLPVLPEHTHTHLVAPGAGTDEASARYAERWADSYRYGAFYWRLGPGFIAVKDVRDDSDAARMVIDDGVDAFVALAEASTLAEAGAVDAEVLDAAAEAGLLVYTDESVLVLPYRMRHWTVPYAAI